MNRVFLALVCASGFGCAGMRYGDGKIGRVSIEPAIEAVADYVDTKAPGQGDRIRSYYSESKIDRVPNGYEIDWDSILDGKVIDESKILRIPKLVPASGVASATVEIKPSTTGVVEQAVSDAVEEGLRNIGKQLPESKAKSNTGD